MKSLKAIQRKARKDIVRNKKIRLILKGSDNGTGKEPTQISPLERVILINH
jgi:hypothetical protein